MDPTCQQSRDLILAIKRAHRFRRDTGVILDRAACLASRWVALGFGQSDGLLLGEAIKAADGRRDDPWGPAAPREREARGRVVGRSVEDLAATT